MECNSFQYLVYLTSTETSGTTSSRQKQRSSSHRRSMSSLMTLLRRNSGSSSRSAHCHSIIDQSVHYPVMMTLHPGMAGLVGKKKTPRRPPLVRHESRSFFQLLRPARSGSSTRRQQSCFIVQRNGDTIIMKGDKIVSVRRGSRDAEPSPRPSYRIRWQHEVSHSSDAGHVSVGVVGDSPANTIVGTSGGGDNV